MNSQMGVPPWIVALIILILATGAGVFAVHKESFIASSVQTRRRLIPEPAQPLPDRQVFQPYGPYIRNIQANDMHATQGFTGGPPPPAKRPGMYPGMDQNIAGTSVPLGYSATGEQGNPETESLLNTLISSAQRAIGGDIAIKPTDENLNRAAGGDEEPANTPLTQAYQPHQQRLHPDDKPRPAYSQVTASAHTDIGTGAEKIQSESVRMPSLREHVREEERAESENFTNQYSIHYQSY